MPSIVLVDKTKINVENEVKLTSTQEVKIVRMKTERVDKKRLNNTSVAYNKTDSNKEIADQLLPKYQSLTVVDKGQSYSCDNRTRL